MHVLVDSPLFFTFGFLNYLWTCLSHIFWRIHIPKPELLPPSTHLTHPVLPQPSDPHRHHHDVNGVTKGNINFKFTSYYYYQDYEIDRESETLTEEWEEREGGSLWWWQNLLRTKTGENQNGWYTCQDLTALNGNVVRFWDGGFRFHTFATEEESNNRYVRLYASN